ncbi:MAG: ankyrin repeat domain-containing protein [Proteobacteria bacterium]|nr:ankyrin repeat domain-containing protein [Pseudomonadota bacterium]
MSRQWFETARGADPAAIGKLIRFDPTLLDEVDSHGRTALHIVAALGRADAVPAAKVLIAAGTPVDIADPEGHTPLWHALTHGREREMVLFLLEVGAATDGCVHPAVDLGDAAVLQELIDCGADLSETLNGETAQQYADRTGRADLAALLAAG